MSYKTQSHSLAEQVNNLADVYSQVEAVPLAKAKIRRQARKGLVATEGTEASSVMAIVDAYAGVFGAETVTPDPRSGATRVGWWREPFSAYSDKALKHAHRIGWARRKLRPELSDEADRVIRGRSSTETVSSFSMDLSLLTTQDPTIFEVTGTITLSIVYADGTVPSSISGSVSQTPAQADIFGVSLGAVTTSGNELEFTFEVTASSTSITRLLFDLSFTAYEPGIDLNGAPVSEVDGSTSSGQEQIIVPIELS